MEELIQYLSLALQCSASIESESASKSSKYYGLTAFTQNPTPFPSVLPLELKSR